MTYDKAVSALATDSAAVVWAGRDYEALAASFGGNVDVQANPIIDDARKALSAAPDAPTRLMVLKNATAALGALLADREQTRAAGVARLEASRREIAELHRERGAAEMRRQRAFRATFPIFQHLRTRLQAAESHFGNAATAADISAAEAALNDAFTTATASIAVAVTAILPTAA